MKKLLAIAIAGFSIWFGYQYTKLRIEIEETEQLIAETKATLDIVEKAGF